MSLYISQSDKLRIAVRMSFSGEATSTQREKRRASTCQSMAEKLLLLAYGQIVSFLELPSESENTIKYMIIWHDNHSFLSSTNNNNIIEETDDKFIIPKGALLPDQDNVITIIQVDDQHPALNVPCSYIYRTIWV